LIVDDSTVVRRMVSEALAADPALEVAGTAANGKIALTRLEQLNPDAVILDIEMPEMDGLAALREMRKTHPKLPIIMFSSLTERGATATLDALALGATDYFAKPAGVSGPDAALRVLRDELIPEIKALCRGRVAPHAPPPPVAAPLTPPISRTRPPTESVQIVAITTSTGGPNALADLFAGFPAALPVPVVLVQHMPPMFTRLLAERLSARSAVPVAEGQAGVRVVPGCGWIAPGGLHMLVGRDGAAVTLRLSEDPPENSCRPAADVLFRSVAQVYGPGVLAVVLTGMGQDGLRGCQAIRDAGGSVLAQDEASSVVWGMPGAVVRAGLADGVLPLNQMAAEVMRRVQVGRGTPR
jgi:two-component system chemotaxis response regulator CheB